MADPKTVYLLGAGASRGSDFSLPVLQGFFDKFHLPKGLLSFLHWYYAGEPDRRKWNVEDVLSYMFLSSAQLQRWSGKARPAYGGEPFGYDDLVAFVLERLQIDQQKHCARHLKLAESLHLQDTVITMNYDMIMDACIEKVERGRKQPVYMNAARTAATLVKLATRVEILSGFLDATSCAFVQPFGLMEQERDRGYYLKLHGAVNWVHCSNPDCRNNSRFHYSGRPSDAGGESAGGPCRECGAPLRAFIVPPGLAKQVAGQGRMSFFWNLAFRELVAADRVVVIGVSFALGDYELRWLVRQSMEMRKDRALTLEVVNPDAAAVYAATVLFAGHPSATDCTVHNDLDAYVAGLAQPP